MEESRSGYQSAEESLGMALFTNEGSIVAGQEYQLAVTFGDRTGSGSTSMVRMAGLGSSTSIKSMEAESARTWLIGANGWGTHRRKRPALDIWDRLRPERIRDFTVYGSQLIRCRRPCAALAGVPTPVDPAAPLQLNRPKVYCMARSLRRPTLRLKPSILVLRQCSWQLWR